MYEIGESGSSRRLERITGIEPAWSAWKADALPLSYIRIWLDSDHAKRRANGPCAHPTSLSEWAFRI